MPHQPIPPKNRRFARAMRREPTEAEDRLWGALRDRRLDRIKFKRQAPVGAYIADFLCAEAMLIVEIDRRRSFRVSKDDQRLQGRVASLTLSYLRYGDAPLQEEPS